MANPVAASLTHAEMAGARVLHDPMHATSGDKPSKILEYGGVSILKNQVGESSSSSIPKADPKRISVFERLSDIPNARLQFSEGEKAKFTSIVGDTDSSLKFFSLSDKGQSTIPIPVELVKEASKPFHSTLYGYFLGPRLHFPLVQRAAKAAWGKYGFIDAMMNNNGTYFFKFNNIGGCNQVVEQGPLMIKGVPLFVYPWEPNKGLGKPKHNTCPLWVKLHNIPLVLFNKEGISRIASALGVPKQMDACTTSMCDKAWGRPSFAKVLIDIWAVGELKRELEVIIPDVNGGEDTRVLIHVEYTWEPTQCKHCLVFGHKTNSCESEMVNRKNIQNKKVDADGFTLVKRKQWRPKVVGEQLRDGIKIVEPPKPLNKETAEEIQVENQQPKKDDQIHGTSQAEKPKTVADTTRDEPKEVESISTNFQGSSKGPIPGTPLPILKPLKGILKTSNRFSSLVFSDKANGDGIVVQETECLDQNAKKNVEYSDVSKPPNLS